MRCPFCSHIETKVIESRETEEADVTRRRRECVGCLTRFTTYERAEGAELVVVKKDNEREPFDHTKVLAGMIKACQKRPISTERLQAVAHEIESTIRKDFGPEVSSSDVGSLVMDHLKKIDQVAYIRFASVYREFADLESFQQEVNKLLGAQKRVDGLNPQKRID